MTSTTTTTRNGCDSKDDFKKSLEDIILYSGTKANFFTYSYIYLDIKESQYGENNEIKSHLDVIAEGISCIRDEGWMFGKWKQNERRSMIPALLALYDLVEGFNWSSHNQHSNYAWM
jgi:hypothetical protein